MVRATGGRAPVRAALAAAALLFLATVAGAAAAEAPRPDDVLWDSIRGSGYVEMFEFFVEKFPDSPHAREAWVMIGVLKGNIPAVVTKEKTVAERAAEAARQAAPAPATAGGLDPRNLDIARFQRDLRARGCNAGIDDGIWGERTTGAAQRFVDALGLDIDPSRPGVALFGAVRNGEGDVCGEY